MEQNVIPVFFSADENYAPWLDCAVRSMMEHASGAYSYRIIVLYQNLTEESRKKIASGVRAPFEIRFVPMEGELADITDRAENRMRIDYFTLTIYFRLFIADKFPEYKKGIYLDSDIVVPGDISELYQVELGDNIIGACADRSFLLVPELVEYVEDAVGIQIDQYVNSGVLLMNLEKMREMKFSEHFLRLLQTFHFDCIAPDQDYINAMCNGRIVYLDGAWDVMPPMGEKKADVPCDGKRPLPKLIHYNLFQKPWCYDDVPYEDYFWRCAKKSPFYPDIVSHKENYSGEQKEADRTCFDRMIEKGFRICSRMETPSRAVRPQDGQPDEWCCPLVTFRRMFERGEKIRI